MAGYWSVDELAAYLGVVPKTIYPEVPSLPGTFKINGKGRWFIDKEMVIAHFKDLASKPTKRDPGGSDGANRHGL